MGKTDGQNIYIIDAHCSAVSSQKIIRPLVYMEQMFIDQTNLLKNRLIPPS